MSDLPPSNEPGAPGSPTPYIPPAAEPYPTDGKRKVGPAIGAAFCALVTVVLVAAFFGACATLVPGDSGGYHEAGAVIFAVFAAGAAVYFWRMSAPDLPRG